MADENPIQADASGSEILTAGGLVLRVIVPARDEEENLGACLTTLVAQSEPGWELGRHWEVLVVDDQSQDRTRAVADAFAASHPGVRVLEASAPPKGWTGKAHACHLGAGAPDAPPWLLFTDANSLHEAGAVSRALVEAERYKVRFLSYAPRPILSGLAQRAILPLVLSEVANAYPLQQVNNPERRLASADGHFLLIRTDAFLQIGGYEAVCRSQVPDVDLAFLAKRRKVALRFRYAPEAVSVAPASSFAVLWQDWKRKLALLIDNSMLLAAWRALDVGLVVGLPLLALRYSWYPIACVGFLLLWLRTLWRIYRRAAKSNLQAGDVALSLLGLPAFVALLVASWYANRLFGGVAWKGRTRSGARA